jgi:hypothetical protein
MQSMDKARLQQWLIPFLFGVSVGIIFVWNVELWITGRGAVSNYLAPFAIATLLVALFFKSRTGYDWPWQLGSAAEQTNKGGPKAGNGSDSQNR